MKDGGDLGQAAARGISIEERKTGSRTDGGHSRPQTEGLYVHQF